MSDFFTYSELSSGTTARVAALNTIFAALSAAFDMLPTEDNLKLGLVQFGTDDGAANAYTVTLPHPVSSYTNGMIVTFVPDNSNTSTTVTLNVDSVGAKTVTLADGSSPAVGVIKADYFTTVRYNSTNDKWEIQGVVDATAYDVSATIAAAIAAHLSATETLTNKTLTAPTISGKLTSDGELEAASLDINGVADVSSTLDIGAGTTRRVAPAGTFVNEGDGNPTCSDTSLSVSTVIAESTWESIGPTSPGTANNVWTALDSVPVDADWIEVRLLAAASTVGDTPSTLRTMNVYARSGDSSETEAQSNRLQYIISYIDSNGCGAASAVNDCKIQVSSLEFDMFWVSTFPDSYSVVIRLTGWGFNP